MVSGADVPAEIDRASTLKFVMPLAIDGDRNGVNVAHNNSIISFSQVDGSGTTTTTCKRAGWLHARAGLLSRPAII